MCQMLDWRAHRTFCHRRDKDVTRGVTSHENKKTLRPLEDFFQSDGSCTIFQSCLCGATDHACAIRERKKSTLITNPSSHQLNSPSPSWLQYEGNSPHLLHWWEEAYSGCRAMSPGPPTPHSYPICNIWGQHEGPPHIKALIYFIGGRRHSGCRAMSPGPPTPHSYPPMHKQAHVTKKHNKNNENSIWKNKMLLHSNWRIFGRKFALES